MTNPGFQPSMCGCPGIAHSPGCRYYAIQGGERIREAQEKVASEKWHDTKLGRQGAAAHEAMLLKTTDAKPTDDSKYAATHAKLMGLPEDQIAAFVLGWKLGSRRA